MRLEHILGAAFIVAVLSLGIACEVSIWTECRGNGNSLIYCLRMVTR